MLSYNLHLNLWVGAPSGTVHLAGRRVLQRIHGDAQDPLVPDHAVHLPDVTGINLAVTKLVAGQVATPSVSDMGFDSGRAVFASSVSWARCRCGSPCCGGSCSPSSPPTCCSRLAWATGSSPSAVTRRARAGGGRTGHQGQDRPVHGRRLLRLVRRNASAVAFNTIQSAGASATSSSYIIAAVIGGCLLTGGCGTAIGT